MGGVETVTLLGVTAADNDTDCTSFETLMQDASTVQVNPTPAIGASIVK